MEGIPNRLPEHGGNPDSTRDTDDFTIPAAICGIQ